jgi:hypothetical protein
MTKTSSLRRGGKRWERLQHQWDATVEIYHFLSRALGERVAVAQIVDLDVANVITILGVDVGVQTSGSRGLCSTSGRAFGLRMTGQRWIGMGIWIGGTSMCWTPLRAWICALILAAAAAAAAAGSLGAGLFVAETGLRVR